MADNEANSTTSPPASVGADIDEDIPYPTVELYSHTILRGANLGSVLSLVLAPPYLLFRGVRSPGEMLRRTGSITAKGTAAGIILAIVMTVARTRGNAPEEIFDRSYRLRHNAGQVRMDKFSRGGMLLGGLAGAAAGYSGGTALAGGFHGASMGLGLAVFAHVLTKKKEDK